MTDEDDNDLVWFFYDDRSSYSVWIADDGVTGIAYIFDGEKIVGDVWLYNVGSCVGESGFEPVRPTRESPGTNPLRNTLDVSFVRLTSEDEIRIVWNLRDGTKEAIIYVHNALHAVVGVGDKPGWCVFAKMDSPYAHPLPTVDPPQIRRGS